MKDFFLIILFVGVIWALPLKLIQSIAENSQFQEVDNYLPKIHDLPKYEYSTSSANNKKAQIVFDLHTEKIYNDTTIQNSTETLTIEKISYHIPLNTSISANASFTIENSTNPELDPFYESDNSTFTNRTLREENKNSTKSGSQLGVQLEAQEEEGSEEEGGNMLTGIIGALLGGLSRPDGSIDVDAITSLLGTLISQNPDGSFNFMGLTDLLRSFFGGEGGLDLGALVGGLAGAFLEGVADPPGAKGVGKFVGRITAGILPSLSAPPPGPDGEPQQGIDPFGFVGGFLKTFLSGSSASVAPANMTDGGGGSKSKYSILKAIVSTITSIFTSSSGSSSSCTPTMLCQNQNW